MAQEHIDRLRRYSPEQMKRRIAAADELVWSEHPFLDSSLPGAGRLSCVIGYGMTEDPRRSPGSSTRTATTPPGCAPTRARVSRCTASTRRRP
ncbi:hypothetical protein STENM223S_06967 [Streptomyces tendae]